MLKQNSGQFSLMAQKRENLGLGDRILPSNQRKFASGPIAALCNLTMDDESSNRRAIGLIPMPANKLEHEIAQTEALQLKKFLLSVESRALSCCIRVFSPERKSRSALLIYRGRLIGSLYGSKVLPEHAFGRPAFDKILDEMLTAGNFIDTYPLSEEIVLAGASLFHGGLNIGGHVSSAVQSYPSCVQSLMKNQRTGCVVVKGADETAVCVTYMFEGRIVGVYSFSQGWKTPTQAAALECFESIPNLEVWMSVLPVAASAATTLTESLTGLDFTPAGQY